MATLSQNISLWVNDAEKALVNEYVSSGRKASGNWAKQLTDEITVTQTNINVKIFGAQYTGAFVNGREPSKKGNKPGKLIGIIEQWIKDKGIIAKDDISKKSLAYLITRKIHNEGIKIPNQYNDGKLLDNVFTEQRINDLIKSVGKFFSVQLSSEVINSLKK